MGDIHGAYRALLQCLEKSNFNYNDDRLIALGDVADGWPETRQCIDELQKIQNLIYVLGNHDHWALRWMEHGIVDDIWFRQGGKATIDSYENGPLTAHINFLKQAYLYFEETKKVFVHAGIDPQLPMEEQTFETLLWDRNLAKLAMQRNKDGIHTKLTAFDEVYVGHTPIGGKRPFLACDVWLMDTAAGWTGVLSMMDIETKEVFISDPVPELYPGVEGRKKKLT